MPHDDDDDEDSFPASMIGAAVGDDAVIRGGSNNALDDDDDDAAAQDHSADFQLPLPPLSDSDGEFLRAVAARAETSAAAAGDKSTRSPLRRLIAAYAAEAAAREMPHGLAPVYQGYLLKMSDGVSLEELLGGEAGSGEEVRRRGKGKL